MRGFGLVVVALAIFGCEAAEESSGAGAELTQAELRLTPGREDVYDPEGVGRSRHPAPVPVFRAARADPRVSAPSERNTWIEPTDMATGTHDTTPTVVVPWRGLTVEEARVRSTRLFELVEWPERKSVPFDVAYLEGSTGIGSRVLLVPARPLEDRWYAIRARVDGSRELRAATGAARDEDGALISRFRVGPELVIEDVEVDRSQDPIGVRVTLSERVRDSRRVTEILTVTVAGRPLPCSADEDADLRSDEGTVVLAVRCSGAGAETLEVGVDASLRSLRGNGVTDPGTGRAATRMRVESGLAVAARSFGLTRPR